MDAVKVSDVIGEGDETHRVVSVGDWTLTVRTEPDAEPEIADTDLAPRLGMELKRLRELSARHEKEGNISPRKVDPNKSHGTTYSRGRGRPGLQRSYNEADALFLVTRSERPEAIALTKEMIRVYMLARRGLLAPVQPPTHDPALAAAVEALAREVKALKGKVASMGLPVRQPPSKPAKALPSGGIDLASWRRKILSHVNVPGVLVTSSDRHGKSYGIPINELWQGALRIPPQGLPAGHTEALRSVMEGLGWEHVGPVTVGGRKEDVYLYVAPFGWKPRY